MRVNFVIDTHGGGGILSQAYIAWYYFLEDLLFSKIWPQIVSTRPSKMEI